MRHSKHGDPGNRTARTTLAKRHSESEMDLILVDREIGARKRRRLRLRSQKGDELHT